MDLYASPSTVVNGHNKEYCLAEVLAKVGSKLGVGAVLIDLRAGLSELSAPLLFDPRVKKYLVTSTSTQSISGTLITLDFLTKGLAIGAETLLPEVLLNMVPNTISDTEKGELYTKIIGSSRKVVGFWQMSFPHLARLRREKYGSEGNLGSCHAA